MGGNLLVNGGFEADWGEDRSHRCLVLPVDGESYERDVENVFTPAGGWMTWFRHKAGTWDQPEVRDAWRSGDERRVRSGEKAMLLFTFYRKHDAGFLQQVEVRAGQRLRLTGWAHAWSNHGLVGHEDCCDDGWCSCGVGREEVAIRADDVPALTGKPWSDAVGNFLFVVGIDPTGGRDPLAGSVVWSEGWCIYNGFVQELEVEAVAVGSVVTVFLRSVTLWPFKHNDAYWDDVCLEVVDGEPSPPPEERGKPRVQYERTYVLLPPGGDARLAAQVLEEVWDRERWTIGGSADDAGIGDLDVRRVVALRPEGWPGDLAGFYEEFYPGVEYWEVDWVNDYQLRGRLLALGLREGGVVLGYPTSHLPAVVTDEFGRWRGSYHHNGLDLRSSWAVWGDEILSGTGGTVVVAGVLAAEPWFGEQVRVVFEAGDGREVLVRYAHLVAGSVAVGVGDQVVVGQVLGKAGSTGQSTADHLHVDVKAGGEYADPALLMEWPEEGEEPPPDVPKVLVGFNDPDERGAGEWMLAQGLGGVLCVPLFIGMSARGLDFSRYERAGIRVVVNLRFSWSTDEGGAGTLPPPGERQGFVDACLATMEASRGVWGWTIGNEYNNPREWPRGFQLTPGYVVEICDLVSDRAPVTRLAPGAVDPFYGPGSDCREWFRAVMGGVRQLHFVDVHGYVRGPEAGLCWSEERFGSEPLKWQCLNYLGCVETLLAALPEGYQGLRVIVTECNHLWKTGEPDWGWVDDDRAGAVVEAMVRRAREWNEGGVNPIMGLCLYRWAGDEWAVEGNGFVLEVVRKLGVGD